MVSRPSMTQTEWPARAISIAAARPFGPEPTTTASNSIDSLYTRRQSDWQLCRSLQLRSSRDGLLPTVARFERERGHRSGRVRRNPAAADSIDYSDDSDLR